MSFIAGHNRSLTMYGLDLLAFGNKCIPGLFYHTDIHSIMYCALSEVRKFSPAVWFSIMV